MRITIELEIDQEAYDAKYGPGTEWWVEYRTNRVPDGESDDFGPTYHNVPVPASDYEFAEGKAQANMTKILKDIIGEGLHDWASLAEDGSALKIKVDCE